MFIPFVWEDREFNKQGLSPYIGRRRRKKEKEEDGGEIGGREKRSMEVGFWEGMRSEWSLQRFRGKTAMTMEAETQRWKVCISKPKPTKDQHHQLWAERETWNRASLTTQGRNPACVSLPCTPRVYHTWGFQWILFVKRINEYSNYWLTVIPRKPYFF